MESEPELTTLLLRWRFCDTHVHLFTIPSNTHDKPINPRDNGRENEFSKKIKNGF